jgi:CRISPR-associated protein (TIGR02710 family)
VADEQDFLSCVKDARRLHLDVDAWLNRSNEHRVIVDFTGGTKVMSAALALVAHRWNCLFSYIGGTRRTKDGVGIVIDGAEEPFCSHNPFDALAYQPLIDSIGLFNAGFPASAARLLEPICRRHDLHQPVKRSLLAVCHVFNAYSKWDAFQHAGAATCLDNALKALNDLDAALPGHNLGPRLQSDHDLCKKLAESAARPAMPLVHDLFSNAVRRAANEQLDDAVARLYRATEAYAQVRLAEHGIDTSCVREDQIPAPLRGQIPSDPGAGGRKLGLQHAYLLLRSLDEDAARPFFDSGLDTEHSPLAARNQSILAHGFQPISTKAFDSLRDAVGKLVRCDSPTSFPRLPEP